MSLEQIPLVKCRLKSEKTDKIKLLHVLIFGTDSGRANRKKLREFTGFPFAENSVDFDTKFKDLQENYDNAQLISIANVLALDITGTKDELARRILIALSDIPAFKQSFDDVSASETEIDENDFNSSSSLSTNARVQANVKPLVPKQVISFNDFENLISPFSGAKTDDIQSWFDKFEALSESFHFEEAQKFIFVQRALKGVALLFVKSERHLLDYSKLKQALIDEFAHTLSSADVHQLLSNRRCKNNEPLIEYFYNMKDIAQRGNVDDISLMRYITNGINDTSYNKSTLYGCPSLTIFKRNLLLYEEIRRDAQKFQQFPVRERTYASKPVRDNSPPKITCFNCLASGHRASGCFNKDRGPRCKFCKKFGHIGKICTQRGAAPQPLLPRNSSCSSTTVPQADKIHIVETTLPPNPMEKEITIADIPFKAIIDTGSPLTLLREDAYRSLGSPSLNNVSMKLSGFGNGNVSPKGCLSLNFTIDGNTFTTNTYVIDSQHMSLPVIIGTDTILQGTLTCDIDGVTLQKSPPPTFVNLIDIDNDASNVDLTHITNKSNRNEVASIIQNYKPTKTKTTDVKMSIILSDDIPVYQRPRRISLGERDVIREQIDQWLKDGIIKPSCSDYASPVILVKKKDGSVRLCIDFRNLNKKIIKDRFPLPLIDDVLDQLQNAKIFSTLDLKNGFFHVDIDPQSTKYTAFITHDGVWEFLKAPFGLCSSPAVFSRYLACVFRELLRDGILILYMDDLIIPAETEEESILKLTRVLDTAAAYGLEINFKKCQFLKRRIEFLGHIIENNTLAPSQSKIKAVQHFPEPQNIKQLQSLLGLTGYFRKFIQGYASVARPLSDLLRKSVPFEFGPQQKQALQKLRDLLTSAPVLHIFIPGSDLEVHTDASKLGFGAVLMQKSPDSLLHPIYYMSRKTSPAEEKLSSYELEVLAVIEAIKKFRVYLHGTHFRIVTDCQAFQKTLDKRDLPPKIARWAIFLQDYDFEIVHRPATKMAHVDTLSRYPVLHITNNEFTHKIIQAQATDSFISSIKTATSQSPLNDFIVKNDVLYKIKDNRDLLVVPESMQIQIIQQVHNNGHFSAKKTEEVVARDFFIPNVTKLVQTVVSNCVPCILISHKSGKQEGLLHPISKGDTPLDTYHCDFLGPLVSTNKHYNHLFGVVDGFTKFLWLYPVKSTSAQDALDKLQLQQTVFGNPRRIVTDRAAAFTSTDFKTYCDRESIEHVTITTGVPRANGQIERVFGTLIPVLAKLSIDDPTKWFKFVPAVQRIINSTISSVTKFSPFQLLTGIKMRNKDDLCIMQILETENLHFLQNDKLQLREIAKSNILRHQERSKNQYDKKRKKATVYKVDDVVAIKRTQFGSGLKLRQKFHGPYKVTAVHLHDRYDVQKLGQHPGPNITSTSSDLMKSWSSP